MRLTLPTGGMGGSNTRQGFPQAQHIRPRNTHVLRSAVELTLMSANPECRGGAIPGRPDKKPQPPQTMAASSCSVVWLVAGDAKPRCCRRRCCHRRVTKKGGRPFECHAEACARLDECQAQGKGVAGKALDSQLLSAKDTFENRSPPRPCTFSKFRGLSTRTFSYKLKPYHSNIVS